MFEVLVNLVKLSASSSMVRDAVKGVFKFGTSSDGKALASTVITLVKNSPEWKKDICQLTARVSPDFREQVGLLLFVVAEKLTELDFPLQKIEDFQTCFTELTDNAFSYGCSKHIEMTIDLSKVYVSLIVRNSADRPLPGSLVELADKSLSTLKKTEGSSPRGRGLLTTRNISDEMFQPDGHSVKVVVQRERYFRKIYVADDVSIIQIYDGLRAKSFARRVTADVASLRDYLPVIVDIRPWEKFIDPADPETSTIYNKAFNGRMSVASDIPEIIKDDRYFSAFEVGRTQDRREPSSAAFHGSLSSTDREVLLFGRSATRIVLLTVSPIIKDTFPAELIAADVRDAIYAISNVGNLPNVIKILDLEARAARGKAETGTERGQGSDA